MKRAIISRNSTFDDVREQLTGSWGSVKTGEGNKWLVTRTPFFVHCEAVLEKGPHILPVVPDYTKALYWTSKDGGGSLVIKAGQQTFVLPENAFCEMTIYTEPAER